MIDVNKYLGKWYELAHYPSWFQRNDNYNTTAEYSLNENGTIMVKNTTISNGKKVESFGTARRLSHDDFRVDFSLDEVKKLTKTEVFRDVPGFMNTPGVEGTRREKEANYVVDKVYMDQDGNYMFSIVTDPRRESLYILSRQKHPSLHSFNQIMKYVVTNYDRDRLVQTGQYDE